MNGVPSFRNRLLNLKAIRRLCEGLGVEPHQYRLLLGLFETLGDRQEFMNTTVGLNKVAGVYFGISSLLSLIAFARPSLQAYLSGFLGYSMLLLSMAVLQDAVNSLMNPDEASVLAHLPIRGSTYVAAKLTHLLSLVAIIATAVNLVPAVAGLYLTGSRWYYPLSHLLAAYLAGLFIAFLFCGVCGWLFLFISPAKLKAAALWMQLIALVVSTSILRLIVPLLLHPPKAGAITRVFDSSWVPWRWFVALGLMGHSGFRGFSAWEAGAACLVTIALIGFGFRAFRQDYLINVSTLVQGGARSTIHHSKRPILGAIARKLSGAPSGRGAFSFVSTMCRRDWHFRRQMVLVALPIFFALVGTAIIGMRTPPIGSVRGFSSMHLFPQMLGWIAAIACTMIPYTAEPQGSSIFVGLPIERLRPFVRGVYLSLWMPIVGVTHLCLLIPCAWFWGIADALLFVFYSAAQVSFYLSLMLLFIDGLPFANRFKPSVASGMQVTILCAIVLAIVFAGIEWLIFRSVALVFGVTVVLALLAFVAAHLSLGKLERAIRENLKLLGRAPQTILKELE